LWFVVVVVVSGRVCEGFVIVVMVVVVSGSLLLLTHTHTQTARAHIHTHPPAHIQQPVAVRGGRLPVPALLVVMRQEQQRVRRVPPPSPTPTTMNGVGGETPCLQVARVAAGGLPLLARLAVQPGEFGGCDALPVFLVGFGCGVWGVGVRGGCGDLEGKGRNRLWFHTSRHCGLSPTTGKQSGRHARTGRGCRRRARSSAGPPACAPAVRSTRPARTTCGRRRGWRCGVCVCVCVCLIDWLVGWLGGWVGGWGWGWSVRQFKCWVGRSIESVNPSVPQPLSRPAVSSQPRSLNLHLRKLSHTTTTTTTTPTSPQHNTTDTRVSLSHNLQHQHQQLQAPPAICHAPQRGGLAVVVDGVKVHLQQLVRLYVYMHMLVGSVCRVVCVGDE
jgi:hypothetical protein